MFTKKLKTKALGITVEKISANKVSWSSGFGVLIPSFNKLPIYIPKCEKFKLDLIGDGSVLLGFRQKDRTFVTIQDSENCKCTQRTIIFFACIRYKKGEIIDILHITK